MRIESIHCNETRTPVKPGSYKVLERPLVHAVILVALAVLIYSNSFHGAFVLDDKTSIVENSVVHGMSSFFSNGAGYSYHPNRVIGYLSFALNYQFGGMNVTGYHVVNLAIHIINALLVYSLVRLVVRTPLLHDSSLASCGSIPALLVALLFVAHPIQTQAVSYVVQRLTSLAALFYLIALVMHLRWRLAGEDGAPFASRRVVLSYLVSLTSAVLAMKTKEIAFTLPVIVLLSEFCFFGRPDFKRLATLAPILLTVAIIPLSMLNINKPAGEVLSDVGRVTVVETTLSRWDYLCTQFSVIVTYLRLLFLPVGQNLDYDFPVSHSLSDPRTILSLLLLLTLFAAALLLWRRSRRSGDAGLRLVAFGILWFFITLSVESSVIPIADVIFEHRLYLPSVGFFIALIASGAIVSARFRDRFPIIGRALFWLAAIATVMLAGATYVRNVDWRDALTIWRDTVSKSPDKIRPLNNLGAALSDSGSPDEAIAVLERAIAVKPDHPEAYYNLGRTYQLFHQDYSAAAILYSQAIMLKPDYVDAYINLGGAYNKMGRFAEGLSVLERTKKLAMDRAELRFNLGVAYSSIGKAGAAAQELDALRRLDPTLALQLQNFMISNDRSSQSMRH